MNIACIGWGSLIWDRGALRLRSIWFPDGPALPVEFARHSSRDRVTLVLVPGSPPVECLWALLDTPDLAAAREMLRARERTSGRYIGSWPATEQNSDEIVRLIGKWATEHHLDGVVWTNLPAKWNEKEGIVPSCAEVIEFLRQRGKGSDAEEYIQRAPPVLRTPYRKSIETDLGWTPRLDEDPAPVNELIRSALLDRLGEIDALLGANRLNRTDLNRAELRALAVRLDLVLDALTGVSARDRALVALERAAHAFGSSLKGEVYEPGAELTFPLRSLGEFSMAVTRLFPQFPEKMLKMKFLGPCMVAYARSLRPGRPRIGSRAVPEKWVALRDLAASMMGPDFGHMEPLEFKRTILRARRKLQVF